MTDTCEKCGRPVAVTFGERLDDAHRWCSRTQRGASDPTECEAVAAAYRRGLREGVALARAKFRRRLGSSPGIGPMEFDDWTDVDAELDRRMSIPRASAAPSDKLSVEER